MIYQFPNAVAKKKSAKKAENDEVRIQLDLSFDLPGKIAEQLEELGITDFEGCSYDPTRRCLKASVGTVLYRQDA